MNNPFNSNTFHINSVYTVSLQGAIAINHQKRERQNPYLEMLGEKREKETHIYTVYIPSCIYKQNKKQARANIVYILMYVHRSNSVCRSTGNGDVLFFSFFTLPPLRSEHMHVNIHYKWPSKRRNVSATDGDFMPVSTSSHEQTTKSTIPSSPIQTRSGDRSVFIKPYAAIVALRPPSFSPQ